MKLTEWYSGDQKPVRVGVYERYFSDRLLTMPTYSRWDGKEWSVLSFSIQDAAKHRILSLNQRRPWRGIAK